MLSNLAIVVFGALQVKISASYDTMNMHVSTLYNSKLSLLDLPQTSKKS